jgi:acyl dehydratase
MSIDLSIVGFTTKPYPFTYDWKTLATYTLGIGAKRDELQYLYEGAKGGMKVYPTFAVVPAYDAVVELLGKSGGNIAMVAHGGRRSGARAIPRRHHQATGTPRASRSWQPGASHPRDNITSTAKLFDGLVDYRRGGGGFEGAPSPGPSPGPKDRPADWSFEEATLPEQALLYRISGDINPLHADPEFATMVGFPQGPILHGLATYGFVARAIVKKTAGGDATKLKTFAAQFRKPVWPGDTIVTQGWNLEDGKVAVVATVQGRPDPVLTNAWAEVG